MSAAAQSGGRAGAHIGLIGGIGPAATQFYYRGLVAASKSAGVPYRLTITHAHNPVLVQKFLADDRDGAADIFAAHIDTLKGAGCDVAAVTALAGHFCIGETTARASLPVVNALDVIRGAVAEFGFRRIGLLGAGPVLQSGIWGALDAVETVLPDDPETSGQTYIDMAQRGMATVADEEYFIAEGARLIDKGAEAVMLAGTDLFMVFEGRDPGYRVIDGGELHIAALALLAENGAR